MVAQYWQVWGAKPASSKLCNEPINPGNFSFRGMMGVGTVTLFPSASSSLVAVIRSFVRP
jgi:hypothetical protein